jgi:hypothetical protein
MLLRTVRTHQEILDIVDRHFSDPPVVWHEGGSAFREGHAMVTTPGAVWLTHGSPLFPDRSGVTCLSCDGSSPQRLFDEFRVFGMATSDTASDQLLWLATDQGIRVAHRSDAGWTLRQPEGTTPSGPVHRVACIGDYVCFVDGDVYCEYDPEISVCYRRDISPGLDGAIVRDLVPLDDDQVLLLVDDRRNPYLLANHDGVRHLTQKNTICGYPNWGHRLSCRLVLCGNSNGFDILPLDDWYEARGFSFNEDIGKLLASAKVATRNWDIVFFSLGQTLLASFSLRSHTLAREFREASRNPSEVVGKTHLPHYLMAPLPIPCMKGKTIRSMAACNEARQLVMWADGTVYIVEIERFLMDLER